MEPRDDVPSPPLRLLPGPGLATESSVGRCYDELADADVSFVCGLAYVERCGPGRLPLVPVAAPVLALALRDEPALAQELRVIDSLGPSTIQPVVAGQWLPEDVRDAIRRALLDMADDEEGRLWLDRALLAGFVAVDASSYEDLRRMRRACVERGFSTLR